MTFVPGYINKFLEKAKTFDSDALILDLEDSVPEIYKEEARSNIRKVLSEGGYSQQIYIRVNAMDTGFLEEDLEAMMLDRVDGFMFTKVETPEDIVFLDKRLGELEAKFGFPRGKFKMCPLIECAIAVVKSYEIALASSRMVALVFGGEDYLNDLDGLHKEHGTSLLVPRSNIVIAARAAKVEVIDTPFLDIHDLKGFKKEVEQARELGFTGTLIIHPTQIGIANRAFSPSDIEIIEAKRIMEAIKESTEKGLGVALLDGKLIGPPMLKRAKRVLEKVKKINNGQG